MRMRHEIRLLALALAIVAGLALEHAGGAELASCDPCAAAAVEAG